MKSSNRRQWFGSLLAASAILFFSALAASADLPPDYGLKATADAAGLPTGQPSLPAVTASIVNIILSIVGVLAVVLVVYAGFLWMTSAGNEEKISQAKKLLAGAVIGLGIIFAAYAISYFVVSQLSKATGAESSVSNQTTTPQCSQIPNATCLAPSSCLGSNYGPYPDCGPNAICCVGS